ncbi:MAG TPA: hypothetical protein VJ765_15185 [Chitinophagaceae bacterium]|nr:hypothetical protein [Chitinophagaceae bacterium]
MDTAIENTTGKRAKKDFRTMISARLETTFLDLKSNLKEKKFKAAVKRASKLLANDLFTKSRKEKNNKKEKNYTVVAENIGA